MAKPNQDKHDVTCQICESGFRLIYDTDETSGMHKFCPFCAEPLEFDTLVDFDMPDFPSPDD
jgi:hypothetical protein